MTASVKKEPIVVKYRTVSITVYPWKHPSGRDYFRFKRNNGKVVTRNTLQKAKAEAKEEAMAMFRDGIDIEKLTPEQTSAFKKFVAVDPTCRHIDEFLLWHGRRAPRKNSKEAVKEFIAEKKANAGSSNHNVETLAGHLKHIPDADLCDITASDLPTLTGAARTRANRRAAWITFFKWCVMREYLPYGEMTAPERLAKPIIIRKTPETWTPEEVRILLDNVRPAYLPWLVLTCFNGLRTEEVQPQKRSKKPPLAWEDIHWDRGIIIVRGETAKTGRRRVIPISAPTMSWLRSMAEGKTGRIGPMTHPAWPTTHGAPGETKRLGMLVGGWKRNANRNSFVSYRAAIVGLAKTAKEAGNSEAEAAKSYDDAKSEAEGEAWFNVLRENGKG